MDFFAAEDRARRATIILVLLYLLAIVAVVVATDAAVSCAIAYYAASHSDAFSVDSRGDYSFESMFALLLPYIGAAISIVVIVATIGKAIELRGGGTKFASMLGARFIADRPTDPAEVRLKNVVEEMALAAGVKAPQVCILDNEPGINAFAAGVNNRDPVIGITAGCLTHLDRDELQAIVGHEFSHVLHNDTVLNTRAYSMLFGLLAISVVGAKIVGATMQVNDRDSRGGGMIVVVVGLILLVVGWLGGLAGRMVRAAIVRQREFLADASAVQYTRNAEGVASALYKMGTCGSHLRHSTGEEAEHFLFGSGASGAWGRLGLTRTHPKTAARIEAIRPGYQPSGSNAVPVDELPDDDNVTGVPDVPASMEPDLPIDRRPDTGLWSPGPNDHGASSPDTGALGSPLLGGAMAGVTAPFGPVVPAAVIASGAGVDPRNIMPPLPPQEAPARVASTAAKSPPKPTAAVLANIPADLRNMASAPETAASVCIALAVADLAPATWEAILQPPVAGVSSDAIGQLVTAIKPLTLQPRMALLDILVPPLERLQPDMQSALVSAAGKAVASDEQPDIIALAVYWRLVRYLNGTLPEAAQVTSWSDGAVPISVLVATVARLQFGPGVLAPSAYAAAGRRLESLGPLPPMPPPDHCRLAYVNGALAVLSHASLPTRNAVVTACAMMIAQEQVPESHADLMLRLICDAADADIPDIFDRWV